MKRHSRAPLPDTALAAQIVGNFGQRLKTAGDRNTGKAAQAASFGKEF